MKVKFWGTRGSLPRSLTNKEVITVVSDLIATAEEKGITTTRELKSLITNQYDQASSFPITYGGHTTCTEIIHEDKNFFVDMGTGFGSAATEKRTRREFLVFLTHLHWDHIIGMPFFAPYLFMPDCTFTIYHVHSKTPDNIANLFNGINFPVRWEVISSRITFKKINVYEILDFGNITVTPFQLDHPGGSYGYRFEAGGKSVSIGVDGEYRRLAPSELAADLPFYQNLDLLIFDAQYDINELASRYDWGHSSPTIGVDLALREGIKNLVLVHHDYLASEQRMRSMTQSAKNYLKAQLPAYQEIWDQLGKKDGPNILAGYDGLELDLENF